MPNKVIVALVLILSVCFLVYVPGATGYFLFDDAINIVDNAGIHIKVLDFASLKKAAFSGESSLLGRPISTVSFALNYYFNGLNPYYFKLTNISIHLINGLLMFGLTIGLLNAHCRHNQIDLDNNTIRWMSLTITAAWLLHPLNLTGVLYIVQRMTSLAALFTVSGLLCYCHGRHCIIKNSNGWGWIIASFLLFTPLAIFSKENGALLPVFILLAEIAFFRFHAPTPPIKQGLMVLFGIFVLLPSVAILIYIALNPAWLTTGYAIRDFSLIERLLTETRIVWFYLRMIFAPDIVQLGMYHDDIPLSKTLLQPLSTVFASMGIVSLIVGALLTLKRHPVAAFGILFFLIGHSMESTVLALELVHEHRNYLPQYGVLFALFYYLLYPLRHPQSLAFRRGLAVFFIVMLSVITFLRASHWGDAVLMKEKEVVHHPDSIRANIAMAAFYEAMPAASQIEADDFYLRAFDHYVKAAELSPADTLGLFGLITLDSRRAKPIEESWVRVLAGRIERYPFSPNTGGAIVRLKKCVMSGECKQPPEILETLIQAALRNPTLQGLARSQVLFAWSDFLFRVRQQPEAAAIEAYRAIEINPKDLYNQILLINILINLSKPADALRQIDQVRQLDILGLHTAELDSLQQLVDAKPIVQP